MDKEKLKKIQYILAINCVNPKDCTFIYDTIKNLEREKFLSQVRVDRLKCKLDAYDPVINEIMELIENAKEEAKREANVEVGYNFDITFNAKRMKKLFDRIKEINVMDTEKLNGVSCPGAQGEPGVPGFSPYETFQGRLLMEYTELVERIVLLEKAIESNEKIGHPEGLLERQLSTMKDYKAVLQLRIIDLLLKDKKEN